MALEKGHALAALRAKVNTAYGGGNVATTASLRKTPTRRISTGSISLDVALGVEEDGSGGIPLGRVVMLLGEKHSGKTTAMLKMIAHGQRLCGRCYRTVKDAKVVPLKGDDGKPSLTPLGEPMWTMTGTCDCYKAGLWEPKHPEKFATKKAEAEWGLVLDSYKLNSYEQYVCALIDAEDALDMKWAKKHGVLLEVLEHTIPSSAEQGLDIAAEYIASGAVDLLAIDSIACLTPETELEVSTQEWQQGLQARLVNKGVRKMVSEAAKVRTGTSKFVTQIWINQYRQDMKGNKVTPGGKQQRFATSIEIEFWPSDFKDENMASFSSMPTDDQIKGMVECRINYKILKNRTTAKASGSFRMALRDDEAIVAGQVMESEYLFKLLMTLGLVGKKSPTKYSFRGKDFTSQSAIQMFLTANPEPMDQTKRKVMRILAGYEPKIEPKPDSA